MKFLTFVFEDKQQVGVVVAGERVLRLGDAWRDGAAPHDVRDLIALGEAGLQQVRALIESRSRDQALTTPLDAVTILAPIPAPRKNVFCIGRNYREHIIEGNRARGRQTDDFPKVIEVFTKPPTAVIGTGATIPRHAAVTQQLDYEIELGLVIGKAGVNIAREQALDHIFGYTIINDVTARDLQAAHGQWFKGKGLDRTCPMGPFVVHRSAIADPHELSLVLEVNGETRQDANTNDLLFKIEDIIEQLSRGMTLEVGDIIATGTPSGVGLGWTPPKFLQSGDVIRARVQGLGELVNMVGPESNDVA